MGGGRRGRMAGLIAGKFDFVRDLGAEGVAAGWSKRDDIFLSRWEMGDMSSESYKPNNRKT